MKIEWLIVPVTASGSPARAEYEILKMIVCIFWSIQAAIVVGGPLCDLEIPF